MSEKARGALFNVLGDINGLRVLDAYAGSGALGFEALSRGTSFVQAVDQDRAAIKIIEANVADLGLSGDQIKVSQANITSWAGNYDQAPFDLVICDPPYDQIKPEVLTTVAGLLKPGGLLVVSHPDDAPELPELKLIDSKNYGDANLSFYRSLVQ